VTPLYQSPSLPGRPPLHTFTALPADVVSVLAPRRHPAAAAKIGNGATHITVFTSNGFRQLATAAYGAAVRTLRPDIAVPMADLSYDSVVPHSKRAVRMAERTEDWVAEQLSSSPAPGAAAAVFAPTLPVPHAVQWQYLTSLAEHAVDGKISGLAVYDADILPALDDYPALGRLPRLSLDDVAGGPHHVLRQIALGADVVLLPFVNAASESGLALTFAFPPPPPAAPSEANPHGFHPLAVDLSDPARQTSLLPPSSTSAAGGSPPPPCSCYTCTHHHGAYIHHLLSAKEMLAWTLLQIHNYHAVGAFFASVRAALEAGTFDDDCRRFRTVYEAELPVGGGVRPRARGYHFKSEGGDEPLNDKVWGRFNLPAASEAGEQERDAAAASARDVVDTTVAPKVSADGLG